MSEGQMLDAEIQKNQVQLELLQRIWLLLPGLLTRRFQASSSAIYRADFRLLSCFWQ